MTEPVYAWCFSHGALHHFDETPWCTAIWVGFTAANEADALEAKQHTYGNARFLHELPTEQQLDVIDIRESQP